MDKAIRILRRCWQTDAGEPAALLGGLLYGGAGLAMMLLARGTGGIAVLWPSSGLLLAVLMLRKQANWWAPLIAAAIANILSNLLIGRPVLVAACFTASNLTDVLCVAWLLHRLSGGREDEGIVAIARFAAIAGLVSPAAFAVPSALIVINAFGGTYWTAWRTWFAGDSLGYLVVAPLLFVTWRQFARGMFRVSRRTAIEGGAIMIAVAGTACLVFMQHGLPLLFLPMLPLMIASLRLGRPGAILAVTIIAVIGAIFSLQGQGPVALIHHGREFRLQFFQFYLAVLFLTALPVAALLDERRALILDLARSELQHRLLTETSGDAIVQLDRQGLCLHASPSFEQLLGIPPAEMLGRPVAALIHPDEVERVWREHAAISVSPGRTGVIQYRALRIDGTYTWLETHARALVDPQGESYGLVCIVRDIAQRKQAEAVLEQEASSDPLTGALSRRRFTRLLDGLLAATVDAEAAQALSLAIIDADHFKRVNDTYGHGVGDAALVAIVEACREAVRGSDAVCRMGGEEFAVVLPSAEAAIARVVCERIRRAVAAKVIPTDRGELRLTVSIGVATAVAGDTVDLLIARADRALYQAKAGGRDTWREAA